jgi:hypothetical protein
MEFDHKFTAEATFDGGVVEIKVGGDATFNSTPFPDNITTFDLGNYMVQGGYNGKLDGQELGTGVTGSPLQGRRAYTGVRGLHHVRIPLEAFAPGGVNNPAGLPVRIRFRMTSDVATTAGLNSGWYIDNLAINNLDSTACAAVTPLGPGDVLISEFRFRGPNGPSDEFVEIYNNTNSNITVGATDGSAGWSLVSSDGVVRFTIPNGTTIPARGHFLGVNNHTTNNAPDGYSLNAYAAADRFFNADIADNTGIALFNTTDPANFSAANRLDAAGFTGAPDLYREGVGLTPIDATNAQYSFVRNVQGVSGGSGVPLDTNNNRNDFSLISTTSDTFGRVGPAGPDGPAVLGAPGPEGTSSPATHNDIKPSLVEPAACTACAPNRELTGTGSARVIKIRRRFTNNTGSSVTRLRFRVVDITTLNTPNPGGAQADLRPITSGDESVSTSVGSITVKGTTLEQPPAQLEGGLNSGLTVTVPEGGVADGQSVDVQFVMKVVQGGRFRFFVSIEGLP